MPSCCWRAAGLTQMDDQQHYAKAYHREGDKYMAAEVQAESHQKQIAFQGERGAYGEEAVVAYFGPQAIPLPRRSFAEATSAVADGEADVGLLPIENSQAGSVHEVYDL